MTIHVAPMEEADMPAYVQVNKAAFANHPRIPMMWPRGYTEDWHAYHVSDGVKDLQNPNARLMKAVDTEAGQLIAGSEWTFALDPVETSKEKPVDLNQSPPEGWPEGGNWRMRLFFKAQWEEWRRGNLAGKPYISMPLACQSSVSRH